MENNPLRYVDPSGHAPCYSESSCKQLDEKLGLSSKSVYETPTKRVDEMSPEELWNILNSDYATRDEKAQIMNYIGVHYVLGGGLIGEVKGLTSSIKIGIFTKGTSNSLHSIKGLDDILSEPSKLKGVKADELYKYLKDNGYNPQPLSGGSLKGKAFEDGGGFKVNWGGDRILQYHPGSRHHGDVPYYKLSSGKTGTQRYDMKGNLIEHF